MWCYRDFHTIYTAIDIYMHKTGLDQCWVVLTSWLKTNTSFQSGPNENWPMRIAMRLELKFLTRGENRLERTVQVLTCHPIWELDRSSHFETGPVLMVKNWKEILELSGKSCPVGPELHPPPPHLMLHHLLEFY